LRIKEQETRLTLQKHDDDDDDEHGIANMVSMRRHCRMAVFVDTFFPIAVFVVRMGLYFVTLFVFTLLIFGRERTRPSLWWLV